METDSIKGSLMMYWALRPMEQQKENPKNRIVKLRDNNNRELVQVGINKIWDY
jgi:hypothetical protein